MKIKYFFFPNLKLPFESLFEEKMHCKNALQKKSSKIPNHMHDRYLIKTKNVV